MGRFTRFTRFTRPACNAKHTYASTRVLGPLLIVATTLRKHISSDVRPKNWPELILGLCPTAPEGVGCVFFRVTASRAKRAFWPMASPLASLAGWIKSLPPRQPEALERAEPRHTAVCQVHACQIKFEAKHFHLLAFSGFHRGCTLSPLLATPQKVGVTIRYVKYYFHRYQ